MITATVYGKDSTIARLTAWTPNVRQALVKVVTKEAVRLQAHVVKDKLTGQVLHVRTGTLRRSINMRVEESHTSVLGMVGTNVWYGKVHEFGEDIPAHQRLMTQVFGRQLKYPMYVNVKAYRMPERSFLRSALEDNLPNIRQALHDAVVSAVKS